MTKRYCNLCGTELDSYHHWSVTLHYGNDSAPPSEPRHAGDICEDCIAPALDLAKTAYAASVTGKVAV